MTYILIGIVFAIIMTGLFYEEDLAGFQKYSHWFALFFIVGTILAMVIIMPIREFTYHSLPEEIQELKEIRDFEYFEVSTDGNSVSVYVINENGTFKRETYDESLVVFQEGDKALISISKEEVEWSAIDVFWFFDSPEERVRVSSVTITLPSKFVY